ncbi:MAG: hypothetical protein RMJ84_07760 [Sandaracinaceae bacterium]|nr:hypothetical protein [Sandaracinaceae bacterium]
MPHQITIFGVSDIWKVNLLHRLVSSHLPLPSPMRLFDRRWVAASHQWLASHLFRMC